jgi:hypothetical protein
VPFVLTDKQRYMHNLEYFYYKVVTKTLPNDRYFTIQELEDVVVINFDCMYDRECSIRGADQLLYLAHKLGTGKRFLFLSEDGANIHLSGALSIITNIIDCFKLTNESCALVCREEIEIPNCTTINNSSIPYWCRTLYCTIKSINIPSGPFDKKFAAWFNRGTFYRAILAKHLYENYKNDSYISYQESGTITDRKLKEYFDTWSDSNTPIIYDQIWPNRVYTHEMIVGATRKPYENYFLEVVAETDILSTNWITEKTVKNLYIGKPFLLFGGVGSLQKLQSYGFKTFNPWFDESYDTIANLYDRLEAIKCEIDRISTLDVNKLYQKMIPVLEHNKQIFLKHAIACYKKND